MTERPMMPGHGAAAWRWRGVATAAALVAGAGGPLAALSAQENFRNGGDGAAATRPAAAAGCPSDASAARCGNERNTAMSKHKGGDAASGPVVNWEPPGKRELVERALADGESDPARIAAWARSRDVTMTVEEARRLIAEIRGRRP